VARCFSCGSKTATELFTCPACQSVGLLKEIRAGAAGMARTQRAGFAELAEIQRRGFDQLRDGLAHITEELSTLASAMESGFEDLHWAIEQQTEVLTSIDRTLKNPSQSQALEWRRMAEQLLARGCLKEAGEWFHKSLAQNPLDFQTYVGFAMTCLQANRFDLAKNLLERSLPHAPIRAISSARKGLPMPDDDESFDDDDDDEEFLKAFGSL
jgi:hypothetical protein